MNKDAYLPLTYRLPLKLERSAGSHKLEDKKEKGQKCPLTSFENKSNSDRDKFNLKFAVDSILYESLRFLLVLQAVSSDYHSTHLQLSHAPQHQVRTLQSSHDLDIHNDPVV